MTTTTNAMGDLTPIETVDSSARSGFRGRLDDLKARGLGKVYEVQRSLGERKVALKSSMKTSPMLWAGVAAGSGFALGMLGRIVQWRSKRRQAMPELVIIDATC